MRGRVVVIFVALGLLAGACRPVGGPSDGDPGRRFRATGWFRTAFDGHRWWLVTPDGRPFYSTGINHVSTSNDVDRVTGGCPYCEAMATNYPSVDAWTDATIRRLRTWGFNTIGSWSDEQRFAPRMPYTALLHMATDSDWFAPAFADHAAQVRARQRRPPPRRSRSRGLDHRQRTALGSRLARLGTATRRLSPSPRRRARSRRGRSPSRRSDGLRPRARRPVLRGHLPRDPGAGSASPDPRSEADRAADATRGARRGPPVGRRLLGRRLHASPRPRRHDPHDVALLPAARPDATQSPRRCGPAAARDGVLLPRRRCRRAEQLPADLPDVSGSGGPRAAAADSYLQRLYSAPWMVGDHWFEYVDEPAGGRFDTENSNFGLVSSADVPWTTLVETLTARHRVRRTVWPTTHPGAGPGDASRRRTVSSARNGSGRGADRRGGGQLDVSSGAGPGSRPWRNR